MLTLDAVACGRGGRRLEQVSLTVAAHTITTVNGPADSATLLLATIAGHTCADTGTITIAGTDITGWPPVRRSRYLAYAPPRPRVWPTMTVADQLQLAWPLRRARRTTREQVLELFPALAGHMRQPAETLQACDVRMLSVAVTLLRDKPLLLLDEPFHGLPPTIARALDDHLHQLTQRDTTIVTADSTGTLTRPDLILTAGDSAVSVHTAATAQARR